MAAVVQTMDLEPQLRTSESAQMTVPPTTSIRIRRPGLSMDEYVQFSTDDEASIGGTGIVETSELWFIIVHSLKLYANQRRLNRQLPEGSDSTHHCRLLHADMHLR